LETQFAICSLPRSGSTAIYRLLKLTPGLQMAYEPDFGEAWRKAEDLKQACQAMFSKTPGFKHVWDPNGWPFVNKLHQSTLESLSQSAEWTRVNIALLDCVPRVVFLRRRNQLARIVSDLLGQQTDLWGHQPDKQHSGAEAILYREQLQERQLRPLDIRVIEWYLANASNWEDQILSHVPNEKKFTLFYEDIFGADVDINTRLKRASAIGDWLGLPLRADDRFQSILQPASKLNDSTSYSRIPNFREIVANYGPI
jgi:LPS sulfotransferase NodH